MKTIWKGTIGFGLVNIPVRIYSASKTQKLNLDMLDKHDLNRIRYKRINEQTGKEVAWKDIVKGYPRDGSYIVIEDEDFEKASPKKSKTIEINEFVDIAQIESIYFGKPYYLEPDPGGTKAYTLLREALQKSNKAGIATFILRKKENLAMIRPLANGLILQRLRFADEIRPMNQLEIPQEEEIKEKELQMAVSLIETYTRKFNIKDYKDHYTNELLSIIETKAQGKEAKIRKIEAQPTKAKDLMAALKQSLERNKKQAS
jgi:DNA end-binding protein Ku